MSKIIILTGGIASGKSTIGNAFKEQGYPVIDADSLVHEFYKTQEGVKMITSLFGEKYIQTDEVDRKALGELVFQEKKQLKILEKNVHIAIIDLLEYWLKKYQGEKFVFIELPQYFEMDQSLLKSIKIYKVLLVVANRENKVEFLRKRNNFSKEEALSRIDSQMPDDRKIELSDYVIENKGSKEELIHQANQILQRIKNEAIF